MSDTRMVAIRVTADGDSLRAATEEAYKRLDLFYAGGPILLCVLHINPAATGAPGVIEVSATGYHRQGQLLRCTRSNEGDMLLAFDTPCLTRGYGVCVPEPQTPDSLVGMHRGESVYVLDGDQWVATGIPHVEYINNGNVNHYKRK